MSFSLSTSSGFNSRDHSVEMLASAMTLISLSEGAPAANTGYRSRSSSDSSDSDSLSGWGTSMTRKSYKMDLSSLSSMDTCAVSAQPQQSSSMECGDAWGYYVNQA
jgi:hypothetical protein